MLVCLGCPSGDDTLTYPPPYTTTSPPHPLPPLGRQVMEHKQGTKGKLILVIRDDSGKTEL